MPESTISARLSMSKTLKYSSSRGIHRFKTFLFFAFAPFQPLKAAFPGAVRKTCRSYISHKSDAGNMRLHNVQTLSAWLREPVETLWRRKKAGRLLPFPPGEAQDLRQQPFLSRFPPGSFNLASVRCSDAGRNRRHDTLQSSICDSLMARVVLPGSSCRQCL